MREIIFRGKRIDLNDWIYGYLRECFDENANIKQYKERHYDTTPKIKNSLKTDEKGNSVFVFEWQRNSDGNIILFRMRIGDKNKWYNIFIDEP